MADGMDCTCAAWSENECCCGADWTTQEMYDLREQLKEAERQRDELLADAERYRWLRKNRYTAKYPNSEFDHAMHLSFTVSGVWANAADPRVLDALIDAAIAAARKAQG